MTKDQSSEFLKSNQKFEIVTIAGRGNLAEMGLAALNGQPEAIKLANAIGHWIKKVEDQAGKFRCISCDIVFKYPDVKADGFAICEANNQFLVSGACATCAARGSTYLQEIAMMKLQRSSEPDTLIVRDSDGPPEGKPQ